MTRESIEQLFCNVVKNDVPDYWDMPPQEQDRTITKILYKHLDVVVSNIKSDYAQYQRRIEESRDERGYNNTKRAKSIIDYILDLISWIKNTLQSITNESFTNRSEFSTNATMVLSRVNLNSNSISNHYLQTNTRVPPNSKVLPHFDISPILKQRMEHDKAFNHFISCLDNIYLNRLKNEPNLEFSLDEIRDMEIPEWKQLVLSVKPLDDSLEKRINRLSQIRHSINEFISQISDDAYKSDFNQILKNFYIKIIS